MPRIRKSREEGKRTRRNHRKKHARSHAQRAAIWITPAKQEINRTQNRRPLHQPEDHHSGVLDQLPQTVRRSPTRLLDREEENVDLPHSADERLSRMSPQIVER